jgi:hypothetical protein
MRRPESDEAIGYYFTYIDQVPEGDICQIMERQMKEAGALFKRVDEQRSQYRYAPDKWSLREVIGHLNDTERLFVFRAFWFARGFDSPLPSFDQNQAIAGARADERSWAEVSQEFLAIRSATIPFFRALSADAWDRRGTASGNSFSVRALAYMVAGHATHHFGHFTTKYGVSSA